MTTNPINDNKNSSPQTDTGGGPYIRGNFTGGYLANHDQFISNYFGGLPEKWLEQDEKEYLGNLRGIFSKEIQKRNYGLLDEKQNGPWDHMFVPPLLSRKDISIIQSASNSYEEKTRNVTGTWDELEKDFTGIGLLIGDSFSGKSLLLRWIVTRLADVSKEPCQGSNLPIYVSVKGYDIRSKDDLLAIAAYSCGQLKNSLRDIWHERKRRITLVIDDGDLLELKQREQLAIAINELNNSRAHFHSIIVACRQTVGTEMLSDLLINKSLGSDPEYSEWVMLPMDDERIKDMLDRASAVSWLCDLVKKDSGLRQLISRPGTLIEMVQATRKLDPIVAPTNRAKLYAFLVENLIRNHNAASGRYSYAGVKSKILAFLAFRVIESSMQTSLLINDGLCRDIAARMEHLSDSYSHVRRYVPRDWSADDLLAELLELPVVSSEAAKEGRFEFVNQIYRNFFAAIYLYDLTDGWLEVQEIISLNLNAWLEILILLSAMTPKEEVNNFLNQVLSEEPEMAADLWLEKGQVGTTRVPECVQREYNRRREYLPKKVDFSVRSIMPYLRDIILSNISPDIALRAVNALMPLGVDAIDGLLDAANSPTPIVAASAVYALFQMGTGLALKTLNLPPLLTISQGGLSFNSNGNCNAQIGNLLFVRVPRTFRAEVCVRLQKIDFDPFAVDGQFELWHNPVEWFAINFFRNQVNPDEANPDEADPDEANLDQVNPDWIGLAAACDAVSRCADLIAKKAKLRTGFQAIVQEMTQCSINYGLLCQYIANDLNLENTPSLPLDMPAQLIERIKQLYLQLRFFFGRVNRLRMFSRNLRFEIPKTGGDLYDSLSGRSPISINADESLDIPELINASTNILIKDIENTDVIAIQADTVNPGRIIGAEVASVGAKIFADSCQGSHIQGVVINNLYSWNGIRVKLNIDVDRWNSSRLTGVLVKSAEGVENF